MRITLKETTDITKRCFSGEPASCTHGCPFFFDIRTFLTRVSSGKWNLAYKLLRTAVSFPAVICEICPAPCEAECQRIQIGDEALSIRELEDACVRFATKKEPDMFRLPPKEKSVAVVGAGLSGLSAALALAQKKYRVTVYERGPARGGRLSTHKHFDQFLDEFDLQFSNVEVDFIYNHEVLSFEELLDFDAVYFAIGKDGNCDDSPFSSLVPTDTERLTTQVPGVFMGGSVCGMSKMEGASAGSRAAKYIETYLMTGSALLTGEEEERKLEKHYLDHTGTSSISRIIATDEDIGYSKEEAIAEASRCMVCDCRLCLNHCEMLASFKKRPQKIAIEAYTDTTANPPFSNCTMTRETFSCNICGYCKTVCPVGIDMGTLFRTARSGRVDVKTEPKAFHDFWLRDFEYATGEAAYTYAPSGVEYLFFPGCKLIGLAPDLVERSFRFVRDALGAGIVLNCCGAPAYWAGEDELLKSHLSVLRSIWDTAGQPIFVFACAYCKKVFAELLPEIKSVSLYEKLAGAGVDVEAEVTSGLTRNPATIFTPCAMAEDEPSRLAVKKIVETSGIIPEEFPEQGRCCGYGGHMGIANPSLYGEIIDDRIATSNLPFIVSCANCYELFSYRDKECMHILDLFFGNEHVREIPNLDQKRENLLFLKRTLLKEHEGEDFIPEDFPWTGLNLYYEDGIRDDIDRRNILELEIKEAIYIAEQAGDYFCESETSRRICSQVKPYVTYWVTYSCDDASGTDTYVVHGAYSHRMKFKENV